MRLIRQKELVELLGVNKSTVRRWRKLGILPFKAKRIGRCVFYSVDELEEWIRGVEGKTQEKMK